MTTLPARISNEAVAIQIMAPLLSGGEPPDCTISGEIWNGAAVGVGVVVGVAVSVGVEVTVGEGVGVLVGGSSGRGVSSGEVTLCSWAKGDGRCAVTALGSTTPPATSHKIELKANNRRRCCFTK